MSVFGVSAVISEFFKVMLFVSGSDTFGVVLSELATLVFKVVLLFSSHAFGPNNF